MTHKTHDSIKKKVILLTAIIALVAMVIVFAMFYIMPAMNNQARSNRIHAIYASFKLDPSTYLLENQSIFGDKRVYPYDNGRTFSSSVDFVRGANVDTTVTELKKAVSDAGFSFFEEAYPGSASVQYHFKSTANEYVRVTVSSKLRDDAIRNAQLMGQDMTAATDSNWNAGPSNVEIKVNLDDNNE